MYFKIHKLSSHIQPHSVHSWFSGEGRGGFSSFARLILDLSCILQNLSPFGLRKGLQLKHATARVDCCQHGQEELFEALQGGEEPGQVVGVEVHRHWHRVVHQVEEPASVGNSDKRNLRRWLWFPSL